MEPKLSGPNGGIERPPAQAGSGYEIAPPTPERASGAEFQRPAERQPELGGARAEAAQVAMPSLPTPVLSQPAGVTPAVASDDDVPLLAADDDLIEKEWVDKAKKILAETRDDPHRREQEVSKLQIEYIRKRYGREIGDVSDE